MARTIKTPIEKLETKIASILSNNPELAKTGRRIKYDGNLLLSYTANHIVYSKKRYYSTAEVKISEIDFSIKIYLDQNTIELISRTSIKPPNFITYLKSLFKNATGIDFTQIEIGSTENSISGSVLKITYEIYSILERINKEERKDETIRFKTRASTYLNANFGLNISIEDNQIDWGVRLNEILTSGQLSQDDLRELSSKLNPGINSQVVIQKQIFKQVSWLLDSLDDILEETNLNKTRAKQLGSQKFNYPQTSITGPEHLMEKILTDYGQNTLFGVPALINTNKYVLQEGMPRVQFDILLITNLGEVEVVELKKPNTILLDFDHNRNKFYASSELSKTIAQTERYISCIMKDNDEELKINNMNVRQFIQSELSGQIFLESVRPTGLIIIGSFKTICTPYEDLEPPIQAKFTKVNYETNCERAYRELRDSHRNIKIVTYSDLVDSARLRLQLERES